MSIYISDIQCRTAGRFRWPMVGSMRGGGANCQGDLVRAIEVTSRIDGAWLAGVCGGWTRRSACDPEKVYGADTNPPASDEVCVYGVAGITLRAIAMTCGHTGNISHSAGPMSWPICGWRQHARRPTSARCLLARKSTRLLRARPGHAGARAPAQQCHQRYEGAAKRGALAARGRRYG